MPFVRAAPAAISAFAVGVLRTRSKLMVVFDLARCSVSVLLARQRQHGHFSAKMDPTQNACNENPKQLTDFPKRAVESR